MSGAPSGSGSEAALANSDVALLGNDLAGVPAAVGVAGSTYGVIVQNFGWAMGYNVAALPLAAFGLLDPLIAAVAMGLSSLIVVLNSLRLTRLGRRDSLGAPAVGSLRGRRGVAVSVLLPIAPLRRPDRGQPGAVPGPGPVAAPRRSPTITTVDLPHGGSVETYLDPGRVGVNQFHLIFERNQTPRLATTAPLVTAGVDGGPASVLRQLKVSTGHFSGHRGPHPGPWRFHVTERGSAPTRSPSP